jgi:hypothetical protein
LYRQLEGTIMSQTAEDGRLSQDGHKWKKWALT